MKKITWRRSLQVILKIYSCLFIPIIFIAMDQTRCSVETDNCDSIRSFQVGIICFHSVKSFNCTEKAIFNCFIVSKLIESFQYAISRCNQFDIEAIFENSKEPFAIHYIMRFRTIFSYRDMFFTAKNRLKQSFSKNKFFFCCFGHFDLLFVWDKPISLYHSESLSTIVCSENRK